MIKSNELAIIVYSCDKNSDMWDVFIKLFDKYWNDCKYKLILLTDFCNRDKNQLGFDEVVILNGTWYEMLMEGIRVASTKYVMLWMDDYLICDYVRNEDVDYYLEKVKQFNAANIRLVESPTIVAKTFSEDEEFNYYKPGTAYSICTQVGIWNTSFLKKYINPNWTPWDFEITGSVKIKDEKHPLLASKKYTFPYEEGVRRGKWMDNGVRLCKRNNIELDFNRRPAMSNFDLAWIYFKGGLLEMNPDFILKIQNLFRRK